MNLINPNKKGVWKTRIRKILFVMRLTTVIILLTLFQLKAVTSFGQRISYVKKDISLIKLFKEIKKQTGYNIIWNEDKIDLSKSFDANFNNAPLDEVLKSSLSGMPLSYSVSNKIINIKSKETSFLGRLIDNFKAIDVRGIVLDDQGKPLNGASIKIKGTNRSVVTNEKGEFYLQKVEEDAILVITYLGYASQELKASANVGAIKLALSDDKLEEVEIVSTGYQDIPKERATGSFTLIDNKTLNRSVSPDILSRLNGVTNGLLSAPIPPPFQNQPPGITIRGRATIFSETSPLIVVDNFPFEGDINTINPNDIENITVLKDAAAASIWGTKAGNGVIVITTKKGSPNQNESINFTSNVNVGAQPDLYHRPQLSSSEFIDIEKFLFSRGAYTATINNGYGMISPVVALLNKVQSDPSFETEANAQIDALRNIDVRDQQSKHFYRKSVEQQYHVNISGGSEKQSHYFSAGFDKDLPNNIAQSNSRITIKGLNTYNLFKNRLKLTTDIAFSKSAATNPRRNYTPLLPYEQVMDENGNRLATLLSGGLRAQYTDTAGKGNLLDWKYRPLDELKEKYSTNNNDLTDYRLNIGAGYKIINSLLLSVNYQFYRANREGEQIDSKESFYTRDMINRYSQINSNTRAVIRPIPMGDIYSPTHTSERSNYGRAQINYTENFGGKHELFAIAGAEIRERASVSSTSYLYGYNPDIATSIPIDLIGNNYKNYYNVLAGTIGSKNFQSGSVDRFVSYYANASYIYNGLYTLSGSYRKDESNLFGVDANQKGVPLWSTGIAWNLYKDFLSNISFLSALQLKATYGYSGNVNNSVSAYLTAEPSGSVNLYGIEYYRIVNPPNDNLRWERVENTNLGIDFSTKNGRINGSIEYYIKNGLDLIASSPIAPQTGINLFTGNTANTQTKGVDILINSLNVKGKLKWSTITILNVAKDKIKEYKVVAGNNGSLASGGTLSPIIGYPINPMYGLRWAGLDAAGNPLGYLNGFVSNNYSAITNSTDRNQLDFFGSRTPLVFGSFRNTLSYKNMELSFNLIYKFDYYFRTPSLSNSLLSEGGSYQQRDYHLRWKESGDELKTNVPSLIYPSVNNRNSFYSNSSVLIEKGDHIRFQDIQFNINLSKKQINKLPFSNLNLYCYAANLGLVWKANSKELDPENSSIYPTPRTIAFGLKANL